MERLISHFARLLPPVHSTPRTNMDRASDAEDMLISDSEEDIPISHIDADADDVTQCDMCHTRLGPEADAGTRAFRCYTCELSVQCEVCCSQAHLMPGRHIVQVWFFE